MFQSDRSGKEASDEQGAADHFDPPGDDEPRQSGRAGSGTDGRPRKRLRLRTHTAEKPELLNTVLDEQQRDADPQHGMRNAG
jgi:hypothetical protein